MFGILVLQETSGAFPRHAWLPDVDEPEPGADRWAW
jgi:hypothetical protein